MAETRPLSNPRLLPRSAGVRLQPKSFLERSHWAVLRSANSIILAAHFRPVARAEVLAKPRGPSQTPASTVHVTAALTGSAGRPSKAPAVLATCQEALPHGTTVSFQRSVMILLIGFEPACPRREGGMAVAVWGCSLSIQIQVVPRRSSGNL